jgi:hypothetical protein
MKLIDAVALDRSIKDFLKGLLDKGEDNVEITDFNVRINDIIKAQPVFPYFFEWIRAEDKTPEDGQLVLAPPAFVGQMVYCFSPELGGVFPYFVETIHIGFMDKEKNYWTFEANCHDEETDELLDGIDFDLDDIGKTVFLTREEAEEALAKMKGGAE